MVARWFPWWVRLAVKIVLSRLPINYSIWKYLGLFQHGDMNLPARALETYLTHSKTASVHTGSDKSHREKFSVLELGPGDSAFTAMIAKAMGASEVWLIDAGPFAATDVNKYTELADYLNKEGIDIYSINKFDNFEDYLTKCNANYLTDGVSSMSNIADSEIDFCFSNAVLEHIPLSEFDKLIFELKRILNKNGVIVNRVDLQDHLGGGLNNLRFRQKIWESSLFKNAGFYTNRIRYNEMLFKFKQAGFDVRVARKLEWKSLPIARSALASEFQHLSDEDLLVKGFDVVLTHGNRESVLP